MNWKELNRKQLGDHADILGIKLDKRSKLINMQEEFEKQRVTDGFPKDGNFEGLTQEDFTNQEGNIKVVGDIHQPKFTITEDGLIKISEKETNKTIEGTNVSFIGSTLEESTNEKGNIFVRRNIDPPKPPENKLSELEIGSEFNLKGKCRLDRIEGVKAYWYNLDDKKHYTGSAFTIV